MTGRKPNSDLKDHIEMLKEIGRRGAAWRGYAVAEYTVKQELNCNDSSIILEYGLDDATRDRLIVHGRQDAAHALCNTVFCLGAITWLRGLVLVTIALQVVILLRLFHFV